MFFNDFSGFFTIRHLSDKWITCKWSVTDAENEVGNFEFRGKGSHHQSWMAQPQVYITEHFMEDQSTECQLNSIDF